ncbi:winged helix DNA-binding domain-containing protein [Solirubrobacter soli]|uniref:winged helix DNA-binding domain-containing protein n=1 Tax=Solirubrobacter soli TaxID=363832 RepID=UPI0004045FD7|nr:winged helix DNA-binding domain-containing protein [Solirubrobacter soli]
MPAAGADRALNRALLARQGLLEPFDAPVVDVVEAIGALQAQAWAAPPFALWSRMKGFQTEDLHSALARRELVVGMNLRATLHLVSAREHPAYHAVVEASGMTDWRRTKATSSDALRDALLGFADTPRSGDEVAAFADAWVDEHPDAIAPDELEHQRAYKWRPLVRWSALTRVPEDGKWAKTPMTLVAAPDLSAPDDALAMVVRRHLRAFGPASAEDVASWIGFRVPPVREAMKVLDLVEVDGLFDLPEAPRPDADTPAPPRFLAAFDSALLAYPSKRRTRIVPDELRDLVYLRKNLQVKPTFLVDGFVAGIWAIEVKRREATLTLTGSPDRAILEEGEKLVRWTHPDAKAHHVAVC